MAEKRALYARLIARGVSNSEACRLVGVNRKTGTRWRYGRTIRNSGGEAVHYPPVTAISDVQPVSARFLSLNERTTIADLLAASPVESATIAALAAGGWIDRGEPVVLLGDSDRG